MDAAAISDRLPLEGGSNYYIKLRGQTSQRSNKLVEKPFRLSRITSAPWESACSRAGCLPQEDVDQTLALEERWRQLTEGGGRLPPDQANAMVSPTVINETMARFFWPNQNPLARCSRRAAITGPGGR